MYLKKIKNLHMNHFSKLWLKVLYASREVNSTITAGMHIATDFSQPNAYDINIGSGRIEGREMH